jgi:hypothetical protein
MKEEQRKALDFVQSHINTANDFGTFPTRLLSDGYHTFDELYDFRKMYNALLFNEWAEEEFWVYDIETAGLDTAMIVSEPIHKKGKYDVHKSWRHHDGDYCFGGGWFIVSAMLPTGLISNHYKEEDWDLFQVPEVETAKYEYDGHTAQDVLERLSRLI